MESTTTADGVEGQLILISRRKYAKAGSRYFARGADDNGNVANFVETEQQFWWKDGVTSFVQIRGSVPLFWSQKELSGELLFTKAAALSETAFKRHMQEVLSEYNNAILINLLDAHKPNEQRLIKVYESAMKKFQRGRPKSETSFVKYIYFDYHGKCKGQVRCMASENRRIEV